jgi:hypothetical protein
MWQWVKIPKAIALAAFFLPWVTVSCSNRQIASGSGWNLVSGHMTVLNPITGVAQPETSHVSVTLAIALIAVVIGLIASFRAVRPGAMIVLCTSTAALFFIWLTTRNLTGDALVRRAAERHGQFDAAIASVIRIDWQIGYWMTMIALMASAILALMAMTSRSTTIGVGKHPPSR